MSELKLTPKRLEAINNALFACFSPKELIELVNETKQHYLLYVLRDKDMTCTGHIADRAEALDSVIGFLRAFEECHPVAKY